MFKIFDFIHADDLQQEEFIAKKMGSSPLTFGDCSKTVTNTQSGNGFYFTR